MIKLFIYIIELFIYIIELFKNGGEIYEIPKGTYCESDYGFDPVTHVHKTKSLKCTEITISNGIKLIGSDDHIVFNKKYEEIKLKNIKIGDYVYTKHGKKEVIKKRRLSRKRRLFDITIDNKSHSYYTNTILSHNSIIIGIFLVWYAITHQDRNIIVISQNDDKVEELMDKIDVIISNLPFYLKPGIVKYNIHKKFFDNGCKLIAQTTTGTSGASYTAHVVYIDEFALIHPNLINKFYTTVYPTIAESETGKFIISSTPRGLNKFYTLWINSIYGRNEYNPIRTDYFEVPGRDEEWKQKQIEQLGGSIEDFNQEYGCQFVAGKELMFKPYILKWIKKRETEYKFVDMDVFSQLNKLITDPLKGNEETMVTENHLNGALVWHPSFDTNSIKGRKYILSIDLGNGGGGDYSVVQFMGIYPMSKKSIEKITIVKDIRSFFKVIQIGVLRSNRMSIPVFAYILYFLIKNLFIQDDIKIVLEMNYKGEYFFNQINSIDGNNNTLDSDYIFAKSKHSKNAKTEHIGINNTKRFKNLSSDSVSDKTEDGILEFYEKITVNEALSLLKPENGTFKSQSGNDDHIVSLINIGNFLESTEYTEMLEDLLMKMPDSFLELINYNDIINDEYNDEEISGQYDDDEYDI